MPTTSKTSLELLHRLLFRALVEIRAQGHEHKNKLVFHLADLFHNVVLDLESAAEGKVTYDEALRKLEAKAREKNCERWLESACKELENVESESGS